VELRLDRRPPPGITGLGGETGVAAGDRHVGATQRLPRILGKRLAKDLMFTGRDLSAEEARQAGLVTRISPDLQIEKQKLVDAILKAPPLALKLAKRSIDQGIELDPRGAREVEIAAIEEQLSSGQWMGKS